MIVLDTHILLWWLNDSPELAKDHRSAIEDALSGDQEVLVSSITAWEIALLVQKGRVVLSMDLASWLDEVQAIEGVRFVPVDNGIALQSTQLPGDFHKDPADRIIVATARRFAARLVTADQKILDYPHVATD